MTYSAALQTAIERHDPERYEGRSWEELSPVEQEAVLTILLEPAPVLAGQTVSV